jgi:hypothetical protein
MYRQVGDLDVAADGIARRGLLVRHLVMPGGLAGTAAVVRFLADEVSRDTWLNVMDQYRPCWRAGEYPEIARRISVAEYAEALRIAAAAGLHRGFDLLTGAPRLSPESASGRSREWCDALFAAPASSAEPERAAAAKPWFRERPRERRRS